jgi:phospholipase/carboxylesterase
VLVLSLVLLSACRDGDVRPSASRDVPRETAAPEAEPAEPRELAISQTDETKQLGTLTARLRGRGDRALVLLHGYGAPGHDLVPLGEELARAVPNLRVVLPVAPQAWIHGGDGLAWYERARPDVPGQIERAREALVELLSALEESEGIPPSRVVYGGFSMGATMSLELALSGPHRPAGVVALSGNALPRFDGKWRALADQRVFVSHGRSDSILAFAQAERIAAQATGAGARVTFVPFDGDHEIPPDVIARLVAFLSE